MISASSMKLCCVEDFWVGSDSVFVNNFWVSSSLYALAISTDYGVIGELVFAVKFVAMSRSHKLITLTLNTTYKIV